jgi:kynurenine formamidase
MMASKIVDLTHSVEAGMTTYPGLPGPEIVDHLSREASREKYGADTTFQIGRITMVANTGTYLDSPFHRFEGGADLSELPLDRLVDLPGLLVTSTVRGIGPEAFADLPEDLEGHAVLVRTGWSERWGTPAYVQTDNPFITADGAESLARRKPALVGIDSVNIDDMTDGSRPAHTALLGAGIAIVEHLTGLADLPAAGFTLHAPVVPVVGMGTFPVRAYAVVNE